TCTFEPSGITFGSTAITFALGFAFKSTPVAVTPEQPSQLAVYAVAETLIVFPSGLSLELSCSLLFSLDSFSELESFADSSVTFSSDLTSVSTAGVTSSDTLASFKCSSCPSTILSDDRSFHFLILGTVTLNSFAILDNVSPFSTT